MVPVDFFRSGLFGLYMTNRFDLLFYKIGKIAWIPALILGIVFTNYLWGTYIDNNPLFECVFKKAVGLPCPGCGLTRSVLSLFKGQIIDSILYNCVIVYLAVAYIHFMLLFFVRKHITKTIDIKEINVLNYIYLFVFIILFQWIIKLSIVMYLYWSR